MNNYEKMYKFSSILRWAVLFFGNGSSKRPTYESAEDAVTKKGFQKIKTRNDKSILTMQHPLNSQLWLKTLESSENAKNRLKPSAVPYTGHKTQNCSEIVRNWDKA